MSHDVVTALAAVSIAVNTVILVLVLVGLFRLGRALSRVEETLSRVLARAEEDWSGTLREFRGVARETKSLLHSGGHLLENLALASLAGKSGGGRLPQIVMGINLARGLLRALYGARGGERKGDG
ncbi:MAG: hypothetical protein NUV93_05200 [Firmicutes bacterium]|jgi:hypothetical protein|nr:hypothetical protein [Bacillota bacterium]